tara:strand:+ start:1607 stop:2542 length:936 start_codon:yes stop_codon:yes gene_type:complete
MSKFLITGGNGQIGSHIIESLLKDKNNNILNIDNLKTGKSYHLADHKNLKSENLCISKTKEIKKLINLYKPDIVVHAAASYNEPDNWQLDIKTNALGGVNLIKESLNNHVKRFIYFQTSLCYGTKPKEKPITLDHPNFPETNSYSISKTVTESYLDLSGLDYVTFRLANVVGPRNLSGPLPIFYKLLKQKKKCFITKSRREFIYVKDLVKYTLMAIEGVGKGPYHFSSGSDVSIEELFNTVVKCMKINDFIKPEIKELVGNEVESILLDPSKTFRDFGKINFTPLNIIVEEAIKYYDKYGVFDTFTHAKSK